MAGSENKETRYLARANDLREAVNASASTARGLYFTNLLLLAYVGVTLASTTDEQLLFVSPVTLPILNIDLPIVAFYVVVPWLLVLTHAYLVLQLYLLARRVHLFNDALAEITNETVRSEQRVLLFPFPFVHMLAGEGSKLMRTTYGAIVWITIVWLPVFLILFAQVRFLPYHDPSVIMSARLAIIVELAILWTLWPLILNRDAIAARGWWMRGVRSPLARCARLLRRFRNAGGGTDAIEVAHGFMALTTTTLVVLAFSWLVAVLPGERSERWLGVLLPAPESAAQRHRHGARSEFGS